MGERVARLSDLLAVGDYVEEEEQRQCDREAHRWPADPVDDRLTEIAAQREVEEGGGGQRREPSCGLLVDISLVGGSRAFEATVT